jgi:hypothetical protein
MGLTNDARRETISHRKAMSDGGILKVQISCVSREGRSIKADDSKRMGGPWRIGKAGHCIILHGTKVRERRALLDFIKAWVSK